MAPSVIAAGVAVNAVMTGPLPPLGVTLSVVLAVVVWRGVAESETVTVMVYGPPAAARVHVMELALEPAQGDGSPE